MIVRLTETALTLLKGAAFKPRNARLKHAVAKRNKGVRKFPYT